VLCLALIHHLSIAGSVPLREVVAWLRAYDCEVVVEFPHRADPMVTRLLGGKRTDAHPDYSHEVFVGLLESVFTLADSVDLRSGSRTLYHARPV
jgi:hypothetical protein